MSKFLNSIIKFRISVIVVTVLITLLAGFFTTNLRIVIDPMAILPASHPFVSSKSQLENIFGEYYSFVVAIEPKSGNALDPVVLQKIQRITNEFKKDSGLVKSTLLSVASQNAKAILDNASTLRYQVNDESSLVLDGDYYNGNDNTIFGRLRDNSTMFLEANYNFSL